MDHPKFVMEPSELESSGLPLTHLLPSLVHSAQSLARPPISNFHVAAIGKAPSGRLYLGVNLEFPGLPLHHSVHAEQFLLTNLSLNAESHLEYLAVSAAPCGHCRQFLQEIRRAPEIQLLITSDLNPQFTPLSNFLSHRFGPHDLLHKDAPLLLERRDNALSFPQNEIANGFSVSNNEKLKHAALEAANNSHAPYSGSPSGAALMDSDGNIFKGSYMESAAHNPSLGPVQAAIIAYVAGGGGAYERIVAAVLVEKEGAVVKQEQTAKLLLNTISPQCHFKTFLCTC